MAGVEEQIKPPLAVLGARFSLTYTTVWSVVGPVSSSAVCHQFSLPQLAHSNSLFQLGVFSTL